MTIAPAVCSDGRELLVGFVSRLPAAKDQCSQEEFQDEVELLRIQSQRGRMPSGSRLAIVAAINVFADLAKQGWSFIVSEDAIEGVPPCVDEEKAREVKQAQLVAQRNEQLRTASTRRFIQEMERPRFVGGQRVSVFSLMREGRDLANCLTEAIESGRQVQGVREAVDPYLQFVSADVRCEFTGMLLTDIWRYFRQTWTSPYNSIPGRSMAFLVRDRAAACHPIVGLGALSSAAVKLKPRDDAIGWEADVLLDELLENKRQSKKFFHWMIASVDKWLAEIYRIDLVEDGILPNDLANDVNEAVVERLRVESRTARDAHDRLMSSGSYKKPPPPSDTDQGEHWEQQARTPLFRSKRAGEIGSLLEIRRTLRDAFADTEPSAALTHLARSAAGRRTVSQVVRRARARTVGTCIADLTVCGAVPPYGPLLGGKLVAMLATSPEVVAQYRKRYRSAVSIIASSMAGAPIVRTADLVFIGTTSLYGIRPCQYDRVAFPLGPIGGDQSDVLKYEFLSKTRGFGTFHFGTSTVRAMAKFLRSRKSGARVNYVFGEGANPKLRALREGFAALGFDEEVLLHHGNLKLIYGVRLISNLRDYLLGIASKPDYRFSQRTPRRSTDTIVQWWVDRWLRRRLNRDDRDVILAEVAKNTLVYPITHGARVRLPVGDVEQESLF